MWLLGLCLSYLIANSLAQNTGLEQVHIPVGSPVPYIPCVGLNPDEKISLLYWYKGDTLQEALNTLLIRYENREGGTNYTASDRYRLTKDFGLAIMAVEAADSGRYWCRFVRQNAEQHEDAITVVVVLPSEPVISPCTPSEDGICDVDDSRRLIVECSVTNAFPLPSLTWSFIGCSDNRTQSQRWFVSDQRSSYDDDTRTYNATSEIYLGELELGEDDSCLFECLGTGDGIVNGSSVTTVVVSGKKDIQPTNGKEPGGNNDNGSNDTPTRGLNLGATAVIIVLAFVSMVCLIGIVYLISRILCRKGGATTARGDIEMSRHKENHDEKVCLLNADTDKGNTQEITGEMNRWRYKGTLSRKNRGDTLHGVTGVLPSAAGGLVLATQSGLQCFSSNFASVSVKEDSGLSEDNIISLASYPNSDFVIVGMEDGGLVFVNVLTGKTKSIFPNEIGPDSHFSTSEIAADDVGAIFAGERNDKSIYMMETWTACVKKFTIEINLVNLTAYGSKHVVVSNGKDVIQKYHFKKSKSGYEIVKFKNKISVNPVGSFGIRQITVHAGLLYAVIGYDTGCRILQYDVETFDILQTFSSSLSDLQGLCFFGEYKVALYETNSVKIYEKEETDKLDSYVLV